MGFPIPPAYSWPAPSLVDYQTFLFTVVGIPSEALPSDSMWVGWTYNAALITVNKALLIAGTYTPAVYNLAASLLINYAPDQDGQEYFVGLRGNADGGFNLNAFQPGVVAAASDEGTSTSLLVPDAFKNLTLSDLQRLKDPYGRQYLAYAQDYGPTVWGRS